MSSFAGLLLNGGRRAPKLRSITKGVRLERNQVLRIRDGRGARIRAASGTLWITEESSAADIILLPGDAHRIANEGTAIVLAHRAARLVLVVPPGIRAPGHVDVVRADSEPGDELSLDSRARVSPLAIVIAGARAMRSVIDGMRLAATPDAGMLRTRASIDRDLRHARERSVAQAIDTPVASALERRHPWPYY
jgi:hypothetical protein